MCDALPNDECAGAAEGFYYGEFDHDRMFKLPKPTRNRVLVGGSACLLALGMIVIQLRRSKQEEQGVGNKDRA